MPFDQKSPGYPEVGVLNCQRQTDRHRDEHGNSMTELAQWADSVKSCTSRSSKCVKSTWFKSKKTLLNHFHPSRPYPKQFVQQPFNKSKYKLLITLLCYHVLNKVRRYQLYILSLRPQERSLGSFSL